MCYGSSSLVPLVCEVHLIIQAELNDFTSDLARPQQSAEELPLRLQEWNLLYSGARVSFFRNQNIDFAQFLQNFVTVMM